MNLDRLVVYNIIRNNTFASNPLSWDALRTATTHCCGHGYHGTAHYRVTSQKTQIEDQTMKNLPVSCCMDEVGQIAPPKEYLQLFG